MNALTDKQMRIIAGAQGTTDPDEIVVTASPGGGGGGGGGGAPGGGPGGGGSGGGGSPEPPPPPPPDCPPAPTPSDAASNPAVQTALQTARADQNGVARTIQNWNTITTAANAHNIDPALLGAIALRETNFQNIDQIGGGQGRGVFQIDLGAHPNVTEAQANDVTWAANYAAQLLASNQQTIANNHPNFTPPQLLQATAASYNFGTGNISGNPNTIDQGSTGNNYGSNVVNLMSAFKTPGTDFTPGATAGTPGHQEGC